MAVQILVIEDDRLLLDNLLTMLRFEGYEVLGASNGVEGVALLHKHLPDLVICDILMPQMDGYGVLRELRSDPTTRMIPFIFLTARTDREALRQGMVLGASDYIVKPFDFEDFLTAVRVRLNRRNTVHEPFERRIDWLRQSIVFALPLELRTPLEDILQRAELLREQASMLPPDEIHASAKIMMATAELLERHLENYLLFVQLEILGYAPEYVIVRRGQEWANPALIAAAVARKLAATERRGGDVSVALANLDLCISENSLFKITEELIHYILEVSIVGTPIRVMSTVDDEDYVISITGQGALLDPEIAAVLDAVPAQRRWRFWQAPALGVIVAQYLVRVNGGDLVWNAGTGDTGGWRVRLPLRQDNSK